VIHETDHPDQDKTFYLAPIGPPFRLLRPGALFVVRNWVDRMPGPGFGHSWLEQRSLTPNWSLHHYFHRKQAMGVQQLPDDTEVVYGHIVEHPGQHGLGYIVHQIEIGKGYQRGELDD
jgi:hypothetical protein